MTTHVFAKAALLLDIQVRIIRWRFDVGAKFATFQAFGGQF